MIYLDNAASAMVSTNIADDLREILLNNFANQEAGHQLAYKTRTALADAERGLSEALTGSDDAVVFWAGSGTESISRTLEFPEFEKGNVVTTMLEHPAVVKNLKATGCEIRYCQVNRQGRIDLDALSSLLDAETTLVIVHHVQSELGTVQPLGEIRQLMDRKAPKARLVIDAIQSAGKLAVPWQAAGIDMIFFSGHKIGVPGCAGIVVRKSQNSDFAGYFTTLRKEVYRIGRIDPALALTCSRQFCRLAADLSQHHAYLATLKKQLCESLSKIKLPNGKSIEFLGDAESCSPCIQSFLVPGFQAAVLVRMLSQKEIYISAGSACQAESNTPSKTLTALGYNNTDAYSGLRVSLWLHNTEQDIAGFIEGFQEVLSDY